jgi:hypothetical protein
VIGYIKVKILSTKTNAHGNEDPRLGGGSVKPDNAIPYLHPNAIKIYHMQTGRRDYITIFSPTCGTNGYQQ